MEIQERQKNKIIEICRQFGVKILLLFGSQVSQKTHKESDIDLAFASQHSLDFEQHAAFNSELQAVFGDTRVETVDILKTNPLLKKMIFDEHIPLYVEDKNLYYSLSSYAVKGYLETKILRENLKRYLMEKYVGTR